MLDQYWHGESDRISPEAPVPVVNINHTESRPGGAANVAFNIAELGAQVTLLGMIGKDHNGELLRHLLDHPGINGIFVTHEYLPTTTKLRVISQHQQLIRADFENTRPDQNTLEKINAQFFSQLPNFDVILFSDYGKGSLTEIKIMLAAAKKQGCKTIVDPKSQDFLRYQDATMVTPNFKEFQMGVGEWIRADDAESLNQTLTTLAHQEIKRCGFEHLLITRGGDGMSLINRSSSPIHLPTDAKDVFDVTGAGDTVIAMIALGWASGLETAQAAILANTAAGIAVSKLGTSVVHLDELAKALDLNNLDQRLTLPTLLQKIEQSRLEGEKIVLTNGCFDLLHPGHIEYLAAAKALGNKLIILINDDGSVADLKGQHRPINPLKDRIALLAALKSVDWVIPFSEATPANLIAQIKPDILVKGGDYTVDNIAGAEEVIANGGSVKILPFKEGYSSTRLIERIKRY